MSKSLSCQKGAQVCCGFCSVPMGQVVYRLSRATPVRGFLGCATFLCLAAVLKKVPRTEPGIRTTVTKTHDATEPSALMPFYASIF